MSKKGGYTIIDLKGTTFVLDTRVESDVIDKAYDKLQKVTKKAVMLSGFIFPNGEIRDIMCEVIPYTRNDKPAFRLCFEDYFLEISAWATIPKVRLEGKLVSSKPAEKTVLEYLGSVNIRQTAYDGPKDYAINTTATAGTSVQTVDIDLSSDFTFPSGWKIALLTNMKTINFANMPSTLDVSYVAILPDEIHNKATLRVCLRATGSGGIPEASFRITVHGPVHCFKY